MLGIAAASLALATWRLVRGWRSAADPIIVATSPGVFGAAGALIDGDWSQALGQAAALALAGTSALWAGKPRDLLVEKLALVTPGQPRLLQGALIIRIAAVIAGLIVFVLWATRRVASLRGVWRPSRLRSWSPRLRSWST
jgi:hypothetical protein